MASDPNGNDQPNSDLSQGLDDDLGDDWESAFQAEDFMLSPEEEADDFFINEEGSDDELDLASLLTPEETQAKNATVAKESPDTDSSDSDEKPPVRRPVALPAFFFTCASWLTSRTRVQKTLLSVLTILGIIATTATLFFRSTTQQLAQVTTEQNVQQESPTPSLQEETTAPAQAITLPPPAKKPLKPLLPQAKIRRKWPLPAFFITVQEEESDRHVVARIDLTLVILTEPGQNIPRTKESFIRDSIFQFFANRPAKELRYYALARGEMIHNLNSWLKKDWPDNSLAAIIFNRYEIVK